MKVKEPKNLEHLDQPLSRRQVLVKMVTFAGGAVAATSGAGMVLSACGAAPSKTSACSYPENSPVTVGSDAISSHTHAVDITQAQLDAGEAITLNLLDKSPVCTELAHAHWVDVTVEELSQLKNGDTITLYSPSENSDVDEHDHQFTLRLA